MTAPNFRDRAATVASIHTKQAIRLLDRTAEDFLSMPWGAIDALVSGIPEGDIWFLGGFSGDGKTTALTSAVDRWYEGGKRIYYLGLESRPKILLTHWACKRIGLDAGEVLSGLALRWHDWKERKAELAAMVHSLEQGSTAAQVHFSPTEFVDGTALREAMRNAKDFGADLLILDHIDHIEGDQGSAYEVSRDVCMTLLREAQNTGIRCIVATQFNNEAVKGNRIGRYLAPQPNYVYMGSHKRQIASGMLGLYRPLKHNLDTESLKLFQRGMLEPKDVCEPNTMAVSVMKHRLFGNREGNRAYLRIERGKAIDMPESELGPVHGISTSRLS
jgi:KaiC/GvpD/RAD55 family RecA-like ATPase